MMRCKAEQKNKVFNFLYLELIVYIFIMDENLFQWVVLNFGILIETKLIFF